METQQALVSSEVNTTFLNGVDKLHLLKTQQANGFTVNGSSQNNQSVNHYQMSQRQAQANKKFTGCANKLCKSHTLLNKDDSIEICLETLCDRCQEQFQKDSYCIYCKQIYFDQTDDGKEWIMCEQCSRWVHSTCADFNTKQNPNALFQCIKCKKIDALPHGRRHIPRVGYAKLQKKKNNDFLSSIGFDWELSTQQISQDMDNIRKYLG